MNASERRQALRQYTEQALQQGTLEPPWSRLLGGLVLGSEAFLKQIRQELKGDRREQPELRRLQGPASWEAIVSAVEQVKGERWQEFHLRHGDWGREAALWLGRRAGRLSLRELGESVGMDYAAVSAKPWGQISTFDIWVLQRAVQAGRIGELGGNRNR